MVTRVRGIVLAWAFHLERVNRRGKRCFFISQLALVLLWNLLLPHMSIIISTTANGLGPPPIIMSFLTTTGVKEAFEWDLPTHLTCLWEMIDGAAVAWYKLANLCIEIPNGLCTSRKKTRLVELAGTNAGRFRWEVRQRAGSSWPQLVSSAKFLSCWRGTSVGEQRTAGDEMLGTTRSKACELWDRLAAGRFSIATAGPSPLCQISASIIWPLVCTQDKRFYTDRPTERTPKPSHEAHFHW